MEPVHNRIYLYVYILSQVNGKAAGSTRVEKSVRMLFSAYETFDIGQDLGSPVSLRYHDRGNFKFTGSIGSVNIKYI